MGESHKHVRGRLRQRLRLARRGLDAAFVEHASALACRRVSSGAAFASARHVAAYIACDNEVDVGPIVESARSLGQVVYYPRLTAGGLEFLAADPAGLSPGPNGIPEPRDGARLLPGTPRTLVLVPGVGFDLRCVRLGRGGGHYDRGLPGLPDAETIGMAFEFQLVPTLPEAAWDVRVRAVATEARLVVCQPTVRPPCVEKES
jgi:5-formyltetrahydrofolate cyclo-ligase